MSKAGDFLSLVEKKDGIRWEPNIVGGVKGIYTSRSDVDFRIDVNPNKKAKTYVWMIGRASSDRFVSQGESPTEEKAKQDALKFLHGMEQRGIA